MQKFLATLAAAAVLALSAPASTDALAGPQSAPAAGVNETTRDASPVVPVAAPYCAERYFVCRDRWGGAGLRFRRCMQAAACYDDYLRYRFETAPAIHGCGGWREECARRWGFRTNDYFGCLRYHGCG